MYKDQTLKENVTHGTPQKPITGIHFEAGANTNYPNGFFVERHWHHYIEILIITRGHYEFEINLETQVLQAGDICIVNSEELHQITGLELDAVHDVVLFDPNILDFSYMDEWETKTIAPLLKRTLLFPHIITPKQHGYAKLRHCVERLIQTAITTPANWYVQCKLLLLEFLCHTQDNGLFVVADAVQSVSDMQKIDHYKTIISYIKTNYAQPITLQQLADTVSCSSQYLCRFFKEIAHVSPIQYLIHYRIEQACSLLEHTSLSIMDIALDCGFDNISYFIRKFKELKGCTPKTYRSRL